MIKRSSSLPFIASLSLHVLLAMFLFLSFEKTIVLPAQSPPAPESEIIDAVVINQQALQQEVARLEAVEAKKREHEQARQHELIRKEKEAKEKRLKEEKLAQELKKKNEELKKEAELQKIAQQQEEKARQAKLKTEQEELKRLAKEKETLLAAKQKAEEEKKAAELAKQAAAQAAAKQREQAELNAKQQANQRVKQDQLTYYATLIRNKIHQNWRQPLGIDIAGFACKVAVKLLPTGEVIDALVIESSGNLEFDRSTELAIRKASPFPMPSDPDIVSEFRQFTFTFRPEAA